MILKLIIRMLVATAILYLAGSFAEADFVPFHWAKGVREILALIWVMSFVFLAVSVAGDPYWEN